MSRLRQLGQSMTEYMVVLGVTGAALLAATGDVTTLFDNVKRSYSTQSSEMNKVQHYDGYKVRFNENDAEDEDKACLSQTTIDFICRNVVKQVSSFLIRESPVGMIRVQCPELLAKIQKISRSVDIGVDERVVICNTSVHMAFRSQMYHRIRMVFFEYLS